MRVLCVGSLRLRHGCDGWGNFLARWLARRRVGTSRGWWLCGRVRRTVDEDDRKVVADLALQALDTIQADYGDGAELVAATIIFEVKVTDEEGDELFHGNYKSLDRNSPHHIAGLLMATSNHILR